MELKLYDTLTRQKRVFAPLDPANVRMYVCGPTVYDFAHIGNARPVIVFDVLFRLLRHLYGQEHVTYVRNITDVDDKINARAALRLAERGEGGGDLNAEIRRLTEETYANFKADVAALGCLEPTHQPRATEFIRRADGKLDMITLIGRLIANGNAYAADGHVLFHVPSMSDYGKLSKRPLDEMVAGARVEVAPYKRDPMDFVLWKPSTPEEPGWDSPWGRGRPGWHIECSAMSGALLGETFDIHGGGVDLVFPHHENEIAQSRCAFHTKVMANYWMHNGFLMVEGEKMAKSLGNFITIRELTSTRKFGSNMWHGYVLRLAMLMTQYRQPIDWTVERLVQARSMLKEWIDTAIGADDGSVSNELVAALADDLNTPEAISVLHVLHKEARKFNPEAMSQLNASLRFLGIWNGEKTNDVYGYGYVVTAGPSQWDVEPLVFERNAARARKDFKEADRIRDQLLKMGVVLKDTKDGTTWEVAR